MAFVLGFLVTVAYLPLPDGAHVGRWAALSILVPLARPCLRWPALLVLAALAASVAWSPAPWAGLDLWWHFALAAMVIGLGLPLERVLIGAGAGLAINAGFAVAQWLGYAPVEAVTGRPGLFMNSNAQAEAVALVVAGLVTANWRQLPVMTLAAICAVPLFIPPIPRGAWVALAAAGALALPPLYRIGALIFACALGYIMVTPERLPALAERLSLWVDLSAVLTFRGQGLGSFAHFSPYWQYAHNDAIQITYELGVTGLVAFVAFVGWCLWWGTGSARAILVVFAVAGCFSFPLYQPATLFLAACAAGSILCGRPRLRGDIADGERAGPPRQATIRAAWPGDGGLPDGRGDLPPQHWFS